MISPVKLDEGVYRGSQPKTKEDFDLLKSMGIKYSLNLQTGVAILDDGNPLAEQLTMDQCGIRTYCHPLSEITPPTSAQLQLAIEVINNHKPIYIHCHAGVDRTGMVCATYRIKVQNWTAKKAIEEMIKLGSHPWYRFWTWFL